MWWVNNTKFKTQKKGNVMPQTRGEMMKFNSVELQAMVAAEPDEVTSCVKQMREMDGPVLLEIKAQTGSRPDLGRPTRTPIQNKTDLMEFLKYWEPLSMIKLSPMPILTFVKCRSIIYMYTYAFGCRQVVLLYSSYLSMWHLKAKHTSIRVYAHINAKI